MIQRIIGVGKYRALQRASTPEGLFNILALDHQDSLRRAINPTDPASVTVEQLVEFKAQVVHVLASEASGLLLDPALGAPQAIQSNSLHGTGLLVELEKADYQLAPMPQAVEVLPNWSVEKIKRMGADGVKLFFYYHPAARHLAATQDALIMGVASECVRHDIPLYAEPILLAIEENAETFSRNFTRHLLNTARQIAALGVDVLKLEFPVDIRNETDAAIWQELCEELTQAIDVPWVLLSAGVNFDIYCRQVEIACAAGASGFIVGRAVWGEAANILDWAQRMAWLNDVGRKRLRILSDAARNGRSWMNVLACEPVGTEWYATYQGWAS